jgi:hypothetical protein
LCETVKMDESASEFQVGIGDSAGWIGVGDETVGDEIRPWETPDNRGPRANTVPRREVVTGEPDSTGPFAGGIVVTFR